MLDIILRQSKIVWSKDFINLLKSEGILLTRRNKYGSSSILINHGNTEPIALKDRVRKFYVINNPKSVKYCSNKKLNYDILESFYPDTCIHPADVREFPVIVKPVNGHHGYGIKICKTREELNRLILNTSTTYVIQKFIPIKHEYRFNILDREIFQVSRKIRQEGSTPQGGFIFMYKSLGADAKVKIKFKRFIQATIDLFHKEVGYDVGSYCIDVIKGTNNKYYLSELNSGYGIGQFTLTKLMNAIKYKYEKGDLEPYKVRG